MSNKYIWNEKLIEKLIELYKHHPCLYDAKLKDYHNRDLKRQHLEEIAQELNTISEEIVKKIKCIRTQYTRERQKARHSKGVTGVDGYLPKWVHYGHLTFLDDHCIPKQSSSNFKQKDLDEEDLLIMPTIDVNDYHPDFSLSISQPSRPQPRGRKRQRAVTVAEKKIEELPIKKPVRQVPEEVFEERVEKDSNRFDIFGKYVASELKEISIPEMQRWAKQQITTILYNAQSGCVPSNQSASEPGGYQPTQLVLIRSTDSTDVSKSDTPQSLLDSLGNS